WRRTLWCHGSTCLVRIGKDVFASGLETIQHAKPLNNCRWVLYKRDRKGWHVQHIDEAGRTREPCPMAAFPNSELFLSVNPTLTLPDIYSGPARPESCASPPGIQRLLSDGYCRFGMGLRSSANTRIGALPPMVPEASWFFFRTSITLTPSGLFVIQQANGLRKASCLGHREPSIPSLV